MGSGSPAGIVEWPPAEQIVSANMPNVELQSACDSIGECHQTGNGCVAVHVNPAGVPVGDHGEGPGDQYQRVLSILPMNPLFPRAAKLLTFFTGQPGDSPQVCGSGLDWALGGISHGLPRKDDRSAGVPLRRSGEWRSLRLWSSLTTIVLRAGEGRPLRYASTCA